MIEKQYEELKFSDDLTRRLNSEVSQAQRKEELVSLVNDGLLQPEIAADRLGITIKEFEKLLMCESKASE